MAYSIIQSSFQFGEVSVLLHARVDSPIYYRAVKRLRNMVVIPQGGCERRFGTVYVDAINDHAGTPVYLTDYTKIRTFIFDYVDGSKYLLIFRPLAIDVYYNNVYQSTVTTTYASSEIAALSITQSANIIFIAHGAHVPATLVRASTGPIVLTLNASPTFTNYPTFDFSQNYSALTFQVKVGASVITTAQNLLGQVVTVESSGSLFTTNHAGGLFLTDGGVVRLTTYGSATSMTGRIVTVFDTESSLFHSTNTALGADCIVTEIAFSSTRGYPEEISFFQNRIYFGRTTSLPSGLWGSNYNGYNSSIFNFDDSDVLDTNAISTVLQGNRNKSTVIQHIVGFKTLLVFTTSGMYSTSLLSESPIVPTNVSFINPQTSDSANDVYPLIFDNDVVFFSKGGRKVKTANIAEPTQHYQTKNISVLAPHLVDSPYSAAVFENSSTKDGSWLFMVNTGDSNLSDDTSMDGALSIYQSVPEQEITAWSLATTDGKFRHVVSDEDTVYFIVERVINGNTRLFIEQLSFTAYTDAALIKTQASSTTVSGLGYLEGKTVRVRGKNAAMSGMTVMESKTVSSGSITVDFAVTEVEVGLNWTPLICPLPLNIPTQMGNNLYMPKSISSMYVDFYQSLGIEVDGTELQGLISGDDTLDNPPTPQTNFLEVSPMSGWDPSEEILITQSDPLPMTLIGLNLLVNI